jgi:pimeloyl-ACP methyl ester carboxylesterase
MAVEFLSVADARIAYQRQIGDSRKPGILFLGGYASDMEGGKAGFLAQKCLEQNINFVRFDYRGCGRSAGLFREATIGAWFEDSLAVFDNLATKPAILVGSSMGGWLGLLLTQVRGEYMKAFIGVAAAPDFTETLVWDKLTEAQRAMLLRDKEIFDESDPPDRRVPMTLKLIEEGRRHLVLRSPLNISCSVRLLQGMNDAEVPPDYAQRIIDQLAQKDGRITYIKNGDHRLSTPENLDVLWQTIAEFL